MNPSFLYLYLSHASNADKCILLSILASESCEISLIRQIFTLFYSFCFFSSLLDTLPLSRRMCLCIYKDCLPVPPGHRNGTQLWGNNYL